MPHVSDNFDYPVTVVLDGSGAGEVSFQAVGQNIRLTNIFFQVSTSTDQAVCTIARQQSTVFNSYSGSTGGNAKGSVELYDGQTCYVRWTGGDPGATATATFSGHIIPFAELTGSAELAFDDPIAAGDGSLIFPAIKSPNYVAGVSGWMISRTGTAEFGDAVIRGSVSADGGNITLDNNGLTITGPTMKFVMDQVGFTITQIPPLGGGITMEAQAGLGGLIFFQPDDNTVTVPTVTYGGGFVFADANESVAEARPSLFVRSPYVQDAPDLAWAQMRLAAQESDSVTDDSFMEITSGRGLVWTGYGIDSGKGRIGGGGINANTGAITTTETAVVTSDSLTFRAGVAYGVQIAGPAVISAAPNRAVVRLRKNNTAGQQLALSGVQFANTGTANGGAYFEFYVGGSDVTCALAFTAIVNSGATSVIYQGASSPVTMSIFDIGYAAESGMDTYLNALV